ncbi:MULTISPECIES: hypothetical protein [Nostocaceae]|uniref:hypothetical protein n=1 Tax=Nostocaceae TaxID=1162 RepID=UPI0028C3ACC4|nr:MULTISPECIES: hypothetical protein [Nostocaceae]
MGDDAEAPAKLGFEVTAFDISPTAISWCQQWFPDSSVNYVILSDSELKQFESLGLRQVEKIVYQKQESEQFDVKQVRIEYQKS